MNMNWSGRQAARIGWLATTLVLAAALVLGAWVNYRGVRAAVDTMNRGQVELLEAALRATFDPWPDTIDSADLQRFMQDNPEYGVRYIALLDREGEVMVSAGEPAAEPTPPPEGMPPGPPPLIQEGQRIRTYLARPVFFGFGVGRGQVRVTVRPPADGGVAGAQSPGGSQQGGAPPGLEKDSLDRLRRNFGRDSVGGPPRGGLGGGFRFATNIVEFEPVARGLVARATRSLALAAIGASILTLAAILFWRTSERYQEARIQMEEQRRLSVLGEMSAVLAHEIRNPLASLKGTAQLLAEKLPESSRERARADRIIHEAVRLEALTSDLLGFARSGPIDVRPTDPIELLRSSIADVAEDGFQLDTTGAPKSWTLDGGRVRHVLVNVLQNAQQASPEGRPPQVRVAEDHNKLVYEVRDFGAGLAAGSEDRIFDPFFTTRTNGTGLGLAVSRRVVEMHGGEITAQNHPEGGAVFRIVFPRIKT